MNAFARTIALAPLLLFTGGCALVGGSPPERYGGSATLGEAAGNAARDSSDKQRRLDVGDKVPSYSSWPEPATETSITVSDDGSGPSHAVSSDGGVTDWSLGMVGGGGSLGGHEFEGFGLGGLEAGVYVTPRLRVDLAGMVLSPNLTEASVAGQGLKNEKELALDLSARYYLTPPQTFMGVYPIAGVRFGTLFWDYRKAVSVIADGRNKTISDDYLNYFAFYGGAGLSLVQARHLHAGLHLTGGVRAYGGTTFEGFQNTLFPATGYTQLAVEVTYRH
jgi:hypothetical protein